MRSSLPYRIRLSTTRRLHHLPGDPGTRDELCQDLADGYPSCRKGNRVVLNVARWVKGVPGYGAGLAAYRRYMVNHEVGHRLGHGHELCPGRGRPAPSCNSRRWACTAARPTRCRTSTASATPVLRGPTTTPSRPLSEAGPHEREPAGRRGVGRFVVG
ncbi:DUF3152 domain-containing protein [Micromonospora thermarum]|uniref:DUF3152 domain-containing protein n=1 Tax=Micromonospora thermarum TaxID=2720024 RepID=UPI00359FAD71